MGDYNDIPADILNWNEDVKSNDDWKKQPKKSSFMLTINPNLGRKILQKKEQRILEYRKLQAVNNELIREFEAGHLVKQLKETPLPADITLIYHNELT
jgi:hypothetical protein